MFVRPQGFTQSVLVKEILMSAELLFAHRKLHGEPVEPCFGPNCYTEVF